MPLQALQFLVFDSKGDLSLEDLTEHVCPALNHQQLYRLCTTAWSDAPDTSGDLAGWWWWWWQQLSVLQARMLQPVLVALVTP
jgi:hypothetical protein